MVQNSRKSREDKETDTLKGCCVYLFAILFKHAITRVWFLRLVCANCFQPVQVQVDPAEQLFVAFSRVHLHSYLDQKSIDNNFVTELLMTVINSLDLSNAQVSCF